jgi:hypothetical protein
MDRDSLTLGLLLILLGTCISMKQSKTTPEQIISTGIVVLCNVLAIFLICALIPFLPDTAPSPNAGLCIGFLVGFGVNKMRPTYAESRGMWRGVLHFVLTQMDLENAFNRKKK